MKLIKTLKHFYLDGSIIRIYSAFVEWTVPRRRVLLLLSCMSIAFYLSSP